MTPRLALALGYLIQETKFNANIDYAQGDDVASVIIKGEAVLCMRVYSDQRSCTFSNHATVHATVRGQAPIIDGKLVLDSLIMQTEALLKDMAETYNAHGEAA